MDDYARAFLWRCDPVHTQCKLCGTVSRPCPRTCPRPVVWSIVYARAEGEEADVARKARWIAKLERIERDLAERIRAMEQARDMSLRALQALRMEVASER